MCENKSKMVNLAYLNQWPDAIIFDWDGTLADTRSIVVSCLETVLSHFGLQTWDIIKKKYCDSSKSLKDNFSNFFGDQAKQAYAMYLDCYQNCYQDRLKTRPYVITLLNVLETLPVELFIISNKEKSLLSKEVSLLFPKISFSAVLGHGDALSNKPHSAPVQKAFEHTSISPNKNIVWFIGDSKIDVKCAANTHCWPIFLTNARCTTEHCLQLQALEEKHAITFLDSFKDLIKKVNHLYQKRT